MRTHLNCASCIVDDLCGALQLVPLEEKTKKKDIKEIFSVLSSRVLHRKNSLLLHH